MVNGIIDGGDVENGVLNIPAVAGLVEAHVGRNPFKTDVINSDVVIVVDQVLGHCEELDIPIERHVFAAAGGVVIEFISTDGDVDDGRWRLRAVDGHGQR